MKPTLLLALSLMWVGTALSEEQSPGPALVDTVRIYARMKKMYPPGLAERGVQGKVTLRVDLSAEGKFTNPAIHETSRSEELDGAALALVPRLKFTPPKSTDKTTPGTVLVAIDFRKDELETLRTKTCADFNQDAVYFKEKFPEKPLTEMPVFELTGGVIMFAVKPQQQLSVVKNTKQIKERVSAECSRSPDSKFLELALKTAEGWPGISGGK
jgi:TonB family protein